MNVLVTVAADGRVTDTRVENSSGVASLDAAAAAGVRAWTFKPAEKLGKPVEAQAIVAIDWKYRPGITIGPQTVERRVLLQKDFSFANQVHDAWPHFTKAFAIVRDRRRSNSGHP